MKNFSQKLTLFYQHIADFYQMTSANESEWQLHIRQAEQLALFGIQAKFPLPVLFAQCALTPTQFPLQVQIAIKQTALLLIIADRLHWTEPFTEQLIACSLFRFSGLAESLNRSAETEQLALCQKAGLYRLKSLGPTFQYRQWRTLLTDSSLTPNQKKSWQKIPHAETIQFCHLLAWLLTPGKQRAAIGIEHAIGKLYWQSTSHQIISILTSLATLDNPFYATARFGRDSLDNVYFIVATQPKLKGYRYDVASKQLQTPDEEIDAQHIRLLPPQRTADLSLLERLPNPLDAAAPTLPNLAQLAELDPNQSIRQQADWLAQYPNYIDFVLAQASTINRQKKAILHLNHAMALLGADQLPVILKRAWLAQQFLVLAHPYRNWFEQWSQCLAAALQLISNATSSVMLSSSQAKLLADSLSLLLQQDEQSRFLPLHAQGSKLSPLVHRTYQNCWQHAELPRQLALLTASLGLPKAWHEAALSFREENELVKRSFAGAILAFSLQLTETYFYGVVARPAETQTLYSQLAPYLQPVATHWQHWLLDLPTLAQSYWPLHPEL